MGSGEIQLDTPQGALSATILLPDKAQCLAIVIAGSGPTDRDGNITTLAGKNNSLKYLSESLAAHGIGTLRYDKRLVGQSAAQTISESELSVDTYVEDLVLWFNHVTANHRLPVYFIGHSEGALIATLAAQTAEVDGIALIAAAAQPAADILLAQLKDKVPSETYRKIESYIERLKRGETITGVPDELNVLFRESVQPYLRSWFRYHPAGELSKVDAPVFLAFGTKDLQIPVENAAVLQAAAPAAEVTIIDNMNHVLKTVTPDTDPNSYYVDDTVPINEDIVVAVTRFIDSTLKRNKAGR